MPYGLKPYDNKPPTEACESCKFFDDSTTILSKDGKDIKEFWTCEYTNGCKEAVRVMKKRFNKTIKQK